MGGVQKSIFNSKGLVWRGNFRRGDSGIPPAQGRIRNQCHLAHIYMRRYICILYHWYELTLVRSYSSSIYSSS